MRNTSIVYGNEVEEMNSQFTTFKYKERRELCTRKL